MFTHPLLMKVPPAKITELMLSRRKLLETIIANTAKRKIQNSIQATGDRMSVTPQQFGASLGKQMGKQALNFSGAGQHILGALKTYGRRLTGRSVDPLRSRQRLIGDMFNDATSFKAPNPTDVYSNALRYDPSGRTAQVAAQKAKDTATLNFGGGGRDDSIVSALSRQNQQASRAVNKELDAVALTRGLTGVGGVAALGGAAGMRQSLNKKAFLGPGLLGAGIGAATSPAGHRMEGASRGAVKATGTGLGAIAGIPAGVLTALMLLKGKKLPRIPGRGIHAYPLNRRNAENMAKLYAAVGIGAPAGAAVGGGAGYAGTSALLGKPSWESKQASLLSVLGGLAGGGLGGLAGGAGGGILGALGGGALGGGPGAGLGLLAGGAAGLGAGAHMGGNIGASIGAGFSKKKEEKPESDEKIEEKSEEKSEESGDEEVKESAARVLAQLQKNSAAPFDPADPAARTRQMVNGMRQQGIVRGQWADNGAAGFTPTSVTYGAGAKPKVPPTSPTAPAAKPPISTPPGNVVKTKSRSAF